MIRLHSFCLDVLIAPLQRTIRRFLLFLLMSKVRNFDMQIGKLRLEVVALTLQLFPLAFRLQLSVVQIATLRAEEFVFILKYSVLRLVFSSFDDFPEEDLRCTQVAILEKE